MAINYGGKTYNNDWWEIGAGGNIIGDSKDWNANAAWAAETGGQNPYTNLPGGSIMDGSGQIPGNEPGSTLAPVGPGGWQAGVAGGGGAGGAGGAAAPAAPAAPTPGVGSASYTLGTTHTDAAGAAPTFTAPVWEKPADFAYDKQFTAPTAEDLYKDPSYQFRLDQGRKALENSAAGKGLLKSGGTLKDVVNYGQNAASQEYGNVYNRMFGEYKFDYDKAADIYDTNYQGSKDKFTFDYKGAHDEFQPKFDAWQTNKNIGAQFDLGQFNADWNVGNDREGRTFTGGQNDLDRALTASEGDKNRKDARDRWGQSYSLDLRRLEQGDWQ